MVYVANFGQDPFLSHYHPSVALFASKLVSHEVMPAKPDLSMHTLIHFLDRFVYRNPKKAASGPGGASIMQPLARGEASGLLVSTQSRIRLRQPVNTEGFWKMESGKVNADEVFFHKYFSTIGKGKESAKKKKKADKKRDAGQASDDEENEDEIWDALVNSRPKLEGSEHSDVDVDMEDPESALGSEDKIGSAGTEAVLDEDYSMDEGDEGGSGLEGEDDEALLDSEDGVPTDLEEAFKSEVQLATEKITTAPEGEKSGKKRRRLKNLPTFASVENYAAMLDLEDEEL